ncbi:hypothetical protein HDU98_011474 [Podochytrium sp. JEL0797]|nr:hypothetical protein HDU98_011474 [Podochytrium sp. JEL0797]
MNKVNLDALRKYSAFPESVRRNSTLAETNLGTTTLYSLPFEIIRQIATHLPINMFLSNVSNCCTLFGFLHTDVVFASAHVLACGELGPRPDPWMTPTHKDTDGVDLLATHNTHKPDTELISFFSGLPMAYRAALLSEYFAGTAAHVTIEGKSLVEQFSSVGFRLDPRHAEMCVSRILALEPSVYLPAFKNDTAAVWMAVGSYGGALAVALPHLSDAMIERAVQTAADANYACFFQIYPAVQTHPLLPPSVNLSPTFITACRKGHLLHQLVVKLFLKTAPPGTLPFPLAIESACTTPNITILQLLFQHPTCPPKMDLTKALIATCEHANATLFHQILPIHTQTLDIQTLLSATTNPRTTPPTNVRNDRLSIISTLLAHPDRPTLLDLSDLLLFVCRTGSLRLVETCLNARTTRPIDVQRAVSQTNPDRHPRVLRLILHHPISSTLSTTALLQQSCSLNRVEVVKTILESPHTATQVTLELQPRLQMLVRACRNGWEELARVLVKDRRFWPVAEGVVGTTRREVILGWAKTNRLDLVVEMVEVEGGVFGF